MGDQDKIKERIIDLKNKIIQSENIDHELEIIQERISRLQSAIAIISVGANTEVEMIEKKHRVEDSLETAKSAMEEGIIARTVVLFWLNFLKFL